MAGAEVVRPQVLRPDDLAALAGLRTGPGEPGFVIGVESAATGSLLCARGLAKAGGNEPLDADSVFNVASLAKQFTAFAILSLAGHGLVDLEEPARLTIPELAPLLGGIRVRHLLNLTDGLADYTILLLSAGRSLAEPIGRDETLAFLAREGHIEALPGHGFRYGNTGYFLLSVLAERRTGLAFRTVLDGLVFRPLGLDGAVVLDEEAGETSGGVEGHRPGPGGRFRAAPCAWRQTGDGQLGLSMADYVKWGRALGCARGPMQDFATKPGTLADGSRTAYGAGYFIEGEGASGQLSHHGVWLGWRAFAIHRPDEGAMVAIFANRSDLDVETAARRIATAIFA